MQTTRYPLWKSAIWLIGILAYGVLVTIGSVDMYERNVFIAGGLWIVFLALPAGASFASGHKTAGWVLVGMALMLVVLFITLAVLAVSARRGF